MHQVNRNWACPFPFSPGGEVAGVISEIGEGVSDWKEGDRVIAMTGNGGIAEKTSAYAATLMPLPESMDFKDGAAFPLNYGTTYYALKQRGELKKGYRDERVDFIEKLDLDNINTNFFGINRQPVWGNDFFLELSKTKMGLNLNRGKPIKYYSSDRICSLLSNGLLTFLQRGYHYEDFLEDGIDAIYFDKTNDLTDDIKYYSKNFKKRSEIAFNGKSKYYELF